MEVSISVELFLVKNLYHCVTRTNLQSDKKLECECMQLSGGLCFCKCVSGPGTGVYFHFTAIVCISLHFYCISSHHDCGSGGTSVAIVLYGCGYFLLFIVVYM